MACGWMSVRWHEWRGLLFLNMTYALYTVCHTIQLMPYTVILLHSTRTVGLPPCRYQYKVSNQSVCISVTCTVELYRSLLGLNEHTASVAYGNLSRALLVLEYCTNTDCSTIDRSNPGLNHRYSLALPVLSVYKYAVMCKHSI